MIDETLADSFVRDLVETQRFYNRQEFILDITIRKMVDGKARLISRITNTFDYVELNGKEIKFDHTNGNCICAKIDFISGIGTFRNDIYTKITLDLEV